MAVAAGADKHGKRVAGHGVAADGALAAIIGSGQMTINAVQVGLSMNKVGIVLNLMLVTSGAQSVGISGFISTLGMNLVAINAGDPHLTVST